MRMCADRYKLSQVDVLVPEAVEILKILADPTRLRIILILAEHGSLPVSAIAEFVGKNPAGVSQHLAKMRFARMVTSTQDGNHVLYRLVDEHAIDLATEAINQAEHSVFHAGGVPHHQS